MYRYTDKFCRKCHLQEDPFHNININRDGLCELCVKNPEPPHRDWDSLRRRFDSMIESVRNRLPYEGMIMMSGGKDSAYMAQLLKNQYRMNLLAFIIDNNFEYRETFDNATAIADKLEMPYVIYRQDPALMKRYYRFLFCEENILQQDCGQVCTFCGRFLIRTASDFARSMGIPLVFSGHNPDQIFLMGESIDNDPERQVFMEFTMEMVAEEIEKAVAAWERKRYAQTRRFFPKALAPEEVTLVFPFQHFQYQPEAMMRKVKEQLGWVPIKRFSKTYIASGCKLVKLWAYLSYLGKTNSYVDFEFSSQVRNGTLPAETIRRFYTETEPEYDEMAGFVRELGMTDDIRKLLVQWAGEENELFRKLK